MKSKKIFYSFLFSVLCIIDHFHSSIDGGSKLFLTNSYGVIIGLLILVKIGIKPFLKKVYLLWFPFAAVFSFWAVRFAYKRAVYPQQSLAFSTEILIFSLILLYCSINLKGTIDLKKNRVTLLVVWLLFLIFCICSKNEQSWPIWFLLCFGTMYIIRWNKEDVKVLLSALTNGIILGFFMIQSAAFVFRPYDTLRYTGMYANCNMNALFYVSTMCAFLCKWYELRLEGKAKLLRICCFLFAGAMVSFTIFTECKGAILTEFVLLLVFFIVFEINEKKHLLKIFFRGMAIVAVSAAALPLVYAPMRYLPALFHHPVWFWTEYYTKPVRSWDPIDSDKYISFDDAIESSLGRLLWFVDVTEKTIGKLPGFSLEVYAYSEDEPILTGDDVFDPIKIRTGIWKYYLSQWNFRGHKISEAGVWLTADYEAPHAHNAFIQMGYENGIFAGILFMVLIVSNIVIGVKLICQNQEGNSFFGVTLLLFTVSFIVFGFVEINWNPESLPFMILFVLGLLTMKKIDENDIMESKSPDILMLDYCIGSVDEENQKN